MSASTTVKGPEKARHIDARITHISTDDLLAAFGSPPGVQDLAGLRRVVGDTMRRPAWPVPEWAAAVRGGAEAERVVTEAAPLLRGVDVTGAEHGRSRRYGFHYLNWLAVGVQASQLTGDERYLRAFEQHFDAWVAARDSVTGEWPGLDVIWYSLGTWARCRNLLPALDVLTGSPLSDRTWGAILATLVGGARWAHDEHDVFRHGNWQLVSATELIHIGRVLPRLTEADAWVRRGHERVDEHLLLDVYPDGGHYERSPGYHMMCLSALHTAAVVDARHGSGALAGDPRLAAMHGWLRGVTSAGGWAPHLQDSHIEWPARSLLRGGYVLDDPALVAAARRWLSATDFAEAAAVLPRWEDPDRQRRWEDAVRNTGAGRAPSPARTTVLPESGYALLRAGDHEDALRLVVNAGPHIEHELESHSHRAVLDFTLEGWRQPLLWEAGGPPSYDDPEYLTWFQSGRGHNTVLVDGAELQVDREASNERIVDAARLAVFRGSHRGNRMLQERRLALVREEPTFLVVDDRALPDADDSDADTSAAHTFQFRLHALNPWQRLGPLSFSTAEAAGPGLRVVELGDPELTTVGVEEGRARRPDLATRTAAYGPLHSLVLDRSTGGFTAVVLPFAGSAPGEATVLRDGDVLTVDHGAVVDRVGDASWVRTGRPVGSTDQASETLRWAVGWRVRELRDRDRPLFTSSCEVDVELELRDGELRAVVDAPGRCRVRLAGTAGTPRLNGVRLSPSDDESHPSGVPLGLPYAGRWTISGVRDG